MGEFNLHTQHWRLETIADRVARLSFDMEASKTNVLSAEVLNQFEECLDFVAEKNPRGLLVCSAKKSGFIAGADIKEFTTLRNFDEAFSLIRRGQSVFDKLENLSFPTVSLIDGFCLGGGMELALSCTYRVAVGDGKTRIGLPEVLLGIHPGFGGTVRLTKLIGAPAALDLMLSGRTLDAKRAKRFGIVDAVVPGRHLERSGLLCIEKKLPAYSPTLFQKLSNASLLRPLIKMAVVSKVKSKVAKKHYPAPFSMIDVWEKYGGNSEKMLRAEAESVAKLITGQTAQNLVRAFFLRERLKGLSRGTSFRPKHVHVIGAGTMGGDIAAWCALRGLKVTLQDREPKLIAPALGRAAKLFKKRVRVSHLVRDGLDRLVPDPSGHIGLGRADVVIEAVFEDIGVKKALFEEIEGKVRKDALLATNTSSIPLEEVSATLRNPERLIGLHFFNPVSQMPLVEVVQGENTNAEEVKKGISLMKQIDKLPLPVRSCPGFLVNRVLMPYLMEAVHLAEEGVPIALIDKVAVHFGMPMGPIFLADTVGLDICLHVAEVLASRVGTDIPEKLRSMVNAGKVGKKSGEGFFTYKKGKPVHASVD
ncbi:MAG: 3-hydroxyacyl-CoA dehydrogenase NAD-binding domain-containing protein, partial [Nitrospinota bacterium]